MGCVVPPFYGGATQPIRGLEQTLGCQGDFIRLAGEPHDIPLRHEVIRAVALHQPGKPLVEVLLAPPPHRDRVAKPLVQQPSECDDVIKRAHVSRSRGLPHREVTDGLRRPPLEG